MIEVSHLNKSYGSRPAVQDLSFMVPDGQIYGLLGPNGAGKSTIMNILTGYLAATSGEVKVAGFSLPEQAQQAKAEHTLHFETERARTRANRELSAARMQARAKLAAQRQQIAADTFAADNPIAFLSILSVSPISCVLLTKEYTSSPVRLCSNSPINAGARHVPTVSVVPSRNRSFCP